MFLAHLVITSLNLCHLPAVIVFFSICATEFILRYAYNRPLRTKHSEIRGTLTQPMKILLSALALNLACLFTRYVNRYYLLTLRLSPNSVPSTGRSN
jgi:hypothetical protein